MLKIVIIVLATIVGLQLGWLAGLCFGVFMTAASAKLSETDEVHHDGWWTPQREPLE